MLEIKSISKVFNESTLNEKKVFSNFSLKINQGDFITIIGSNGAGKSTLLNVIAGDLSIDEGDILFKDEAISDLPGFKRSSFMGRVFQNPSLSVAPNMTILENLSMALNKNKRFPLAWGVNKKNRTLFSDVLQELDLGLENMLDKQVKLLSGGQRQALGLMMAIINKPEILLLDEHTAALDPHTAHKILEITSKLVSKQHVTTVMITHNMHDAIKYGNRLIMLDEGEIILDLDEEQKQSYTSHMLIEAFKQCKNKQLDDRLALV